MSGFLVRARAFLESRRLQPDLNRGLRTTAAFAGPFVAAAYWHLPVEATFAVIAAQNIAIVDVRGSYSFRFGLLLAMTVIMAGSSWLGGLGGQHLASAVAVIAVVSVLGGLWRLLSPDYGPSLAVASVLLTLLGLAVSSDAAASGRHFFSAATGGLWGLLVEIALWPFRPQHPLRRAVAESWLAVSDLLEAMALDERSDLETRHRELAGREAALRTMLDQATATLSAARARRPRPLLQALDDLNLSAARVATRLQAFNTALEALMAQPGFAALRPGFLPVLTAMTNTARSLALTIVSHEPAHLALVEVRLRRLTNLLHALQDRVRKQSTRAPEGAQLAGILEQIAALVPEVSRQLRVTVDRAGDRAAFSLELLDLQTWTLRPLASTLNFRWRPDPVLARFIARLTVLEMIGVAIFKYFGLARGYWLPLTVLVVLQPDYGSTRLRAGQRLLGTLAGALAASVLLWLPLPAAAIAVATGLTMFGFAFWLKRNYAIAAFFITLFVVLITETTVKITAAFTFDRLLATAAGGLLALVAAQLFWPVWERQLIPAILARALRANRDYLLELGRRLAAGDPYAGAIVQAKREAEAANSNVFASLQRLSADPKNQRESLQSAAILANGNQRLTRALTAVALHLAPGAALSRPEFAQFVQLATETLEALAAQVEAGRTDDPRLSQLRASLDEFALPEDAADANPAASGSGLAHSATIQFTRCGTELSAMLLSLSPSRVETTAA